VTLLHWASYWGSLEVLQLLLQHDAKINARNKNGQTPLHKACFGLNDSFEDAYLDSIRFLLEHGADVNALDNNHWTPLRFTLQDGVFKAGPLLLENSRIRRAIQVALTRRGIHEAVVRTFEGKLRGLALNTPLFCMFLHLHSFGS
jgi:ankyrin repeat protein